MKKMRNNNLKGTFLFGILKIAAALLAVLLLGLSRESTASATVSANYLDYRDADENITNDDRECAYLRLTNYLNSLKEIYPVSNADEERMSYVYDNAVAYIKNNTMTVSDLVVYIATTESKLIDSASDGSAGGGCILISNDTAVASGTYGQQCTVTLRLINLGKEGVSNIVISPVQSNDPKEWPFVISASADARTVMDLPAAPSADAPGNYKKDVSWTFTVSQQALTGAYPIKFNVQYYLNGTKEETILSTYVNITGNPSNGKLIEDEEEKKETVENTTLSTPRIIVTGFKTEPEEVKAGDTFVLTVYVQNTASNTSVKNIQFDLKAATASNGESSYEAFLPTSGSSTIYVPSIAAGASTELTLELTSRADLADMPYVMTLNAAYEDSKNNPYTATSNISIPVSQEARVSTSEPELSPEFIATYESSNVMFNIYNLGKTTLYNVQVSFDDGTVTGGSTFVGKVSPGGSASVDTMVEGALPNEETGVVIATISFEDEAGNITTIDKEINLTVYEENFEEYYEEEFYDEYYEEEAGETAGAGGFLIYGLLGLAAVIIIVIIIVVAVKKKKKKALLLKELEKEEDCETL